MTVEKILNNYDKEIDIYQEYTNLCKVKLSKILDKANIKKLPVLARTKDKPSLRHKLKDQSYLKTLKEVRDLSGCRIAVYFESSIRDIEKIIYNYFGRENLTYRPRYDPEKPYDSIHIELCPTEECA